MNKYICTKKLSRDFGSHGFNIFVGEVIDAHVTDDKNVMHIVTHSYSITLNNFNNHFKLLRLHKLEQLDL